MTYVITEPCVDVRDRSCVDACPVDCIYEVQDTQLQHGDEGYRNMLYIHPEECIDCGVCEPECPVEAIYHEQEVPENWRKYIGFAYRAFALPVPEGGRPD